MHSTFFIANPVLPIFMRMRCKARIASENQPPIPLAAGKPRKKGRRKRAERFRRPFQREPLLRGGRVGRLGGSVIRRFRRVGRLGSSVIRRASRRIGRFDSVSGFRGVSRLSSGLFGHFRSVSGFRWRQSLPRALRLP